jgi:hypothetical protein
VGVLTKEDGTRGETASRSVDDSNEDDSVDDGKSMEVGWTPSVSSMSRRVSGILSTGGGNAYPCVLGFDGSASTGISTTTAKLRMQSSGWMDTALP